MWFTGYFNIPLNRGAFGKLSGDKLAKYKNDIAFQNVFITNLLSALQRIKINGLEETISERVYKQSLLWYAGFTIFEKEGKRFILPSTPSANINVYGDFGETWVFGANGFNERVKLFIPGGDESAFLEKVIGYRKTGEPFGVYVRENYLRFPFIQLVLWYSEMIADTYRTMDVCRNNLKQPFVLACEESVIPTVKEFLKKRDNNEESILSTGILPADKINLLEFQTAPETLNSCTEIIEWYTNKFNELCGFDSNTQVDKKGENLISDEIHINDQFEALQIDKCIECIQKDLDIANKVWNTNYKAMKGVEDVGVNDVQGDETDPGDKSLSGKPSKRNRASKSD